MENKNYILGLDVSTSTVGICLFEDLGNEGKLVLLTHFEPILSPEPQTQLEKLKNKADLCVDTIIKDFGNYNITRIIVEQPLFNSINQKIAKTLELFNEYLTHKLATHFKLKVDFISVHEARKNGLPEMVGKTGTLMGDFPSKVAGLKSNEWGKFLIMYLVSQRYPNIKWLLNSKLKINKKNFDRADSIVVVLGFMLKSKAWLQMATTDYWKNANLTKERCIEIIEKNVAYEKFTTLYIDNNKELKAEEKRLAKRKYLNEVFEIVKYLNVDF